MPADAKWYPGSVRRATLEFEERLRKNRSTMVPPWGPRPPETKNSLAVVDPVQLGEEDGVYPRTVICPQGARDRQGPRAMRWV